MSPRLRSPESTRKTTLKSIRTALLTSMMVPTLAVFVGAGSAAAQQSPEAYYGPGMQYRYPIAPGIYDYAPGTYDYAPAIYDYAPGTYGYAPCFGINCGLPGGHPRSDRFKPGNGNHGNDGGNGG